MIIKLGEEIEEYTLRNKKDEDIPVYSVTNDKGFCTGYFSKDVSSKDQSTYKIVPYGCFAYNPSRINVGSVDWQHCEDKVIVSPLYVVFKVSNKINPQYLYYYLKSDIARTYIKATAAGSVRDNLKFSMLKEFPFNLRTLEEQSKIVKVLERVENNIELCKKRAEYLDTLVKSRFIEMFGDPRVNDKGWKSGVISDYYKVKGGKRIPKGMKYAEGVTKHPYLRATDMKNETIIDNDIHYIDEDVYEHIKRYTVKGGDIYLTNVGVNLGMAGVIPDKYDGANLTENAVKLIPKSKKVIDGVFLAQYINSPGIQEYINERKMSVGVPKLAIFRIETMPLLLPPMELQKAFMEFSRRTDKSKHFCEMEVAA